MILKEIKTIVKEGYAKIARKSSSCCDPAVSCCRTTDSLKSMSRKMGYTEGDLTSVPTGSNLGLGCGNPVALASLQEGEAVLDLGSGAGVDVFLAANRVGRNGKVIGVDMTPEMIQAAKANAAKGNYQNVEFRLGEIENVPVESDSINVVISNCVINLSPDKKKVFQEAYRTLKAGGRLMVSDIVLLAELPDVVKSTVEAYIGCLGGAVMKNDYIEAIQAAGFQEVKILDEARFPVDLMANDPTAQAIMNEVDIPKAELVKIAASVASIKVQGVKSP